ncbi:hypothetical protein C8F04DRAFT_1182346 [Mycena alexandri]|uniref:Uncharacterized protein n=1 Tax=Mycena alexandri TaxID=1745969 RepID=A0AAD6SYK4_9AGAR|nr:hypothetical protein C8F04DRAFT_1182346 [Mycena alexandri]
MDTHGIDGRDFALQDGGEGSIGSVNGSETKIWRRTARKESTRYGGLVDCRKINGGREDTVNVERHDGRGEESRGKRPLKERAANTMDHFAHQNVLDVQNAVGLIQFLAKFLQKYRKFNRHMYYIALRTWPPKGLVPVFDIPQRNFPANLIFKDFPKRQLAGYLATLKSPLLAGNEAETFYKGPRRRDPYFQLNRVGIGAIVLKRPLVSRNLKHDRRVFVPILLVNLVTEGRSSAGQDMLRIKHHLQAAERAPKVPDPWRIGRETGEKVARGYQIGVLTLRIAINPGTA